MKVTFVRPNLGHLIKDPATNEENTFDDKARMEPLEIAVLAALTPPDIETVLYDDRIEPIRFNEPTDLVAITVEIFSAKRAYEIATEFRKRNVKVILGGIHVSLIPEEASMYADSIFIGDAENVWNEVINDIKAGKLKPVYRSTPGIPHPGIFPQRSIFKGKKYLPLSLLQFGRGCPFSCTYCAISSYFNKRCFYRKIDEVLKEIDLQDRKLLFFVDDNIIANPILAKEFFRALAPMRIKWMGQASIDMANDPELMKLMEKSGCLGHVVGFETISHSGLISMNKKPNLTNFDGYERQIKVLKDHGQQTWAAFTIGHDDETPDTIKATLNFAMKHKFAFSAFNILMPYPNTPHYEMLKAQGRLLFDGKWWLHPDYWFNHAAFVPKHMTAEELTKHCYEIKKEWNKVSSIVSRVFTATTFKTIMRLGFIFRYNYLFRTETLKKQFMKLGLPKTKRP